MTSADFAELVQRLGQAMIERCNALSSPRHLLLCAEVEPSVISPELYRDDGENLTWLGTGPDIDNALLDLWFAAEPNRIWRGVYLEIIDEEFEATFDYPEGPYPVQIEVAADDEEAGLAEFDAQEQRLRAAVKSRFGDKPIVYPSDEELMRQMREDGGASGFEFDLPPKSSD